MLEWIAGQMRGKRRSNHTLAAMVATVVGAAALPLAQLPNVFDIGMVTYSNDWADLWAAAGRFPAVFVFH